jgi:DNA repair exonuclease SbcCD ATPase subunit
VPEIIYKNLSAKNAYSYRELDVPLDKQGLVLVRGLNLDDGGFLGAGKTSIFEVFSLLQMGSGGKSTVIGDVVNQYVGKDMEAYLDLQVDGSDYQIQQHYNHNRFGNSTRVVDPNTKRSILPSNNSRHAHKYIRENILKMGSTSFFHLTYLAQRMTNILLTGTDAQRKHKIVEMFDLDVYDDLYKAVSVELKRLEADLQSVEGLERELLELHSVIEESPSLEGLKSLFHEKKKQKNECRSVLDATIEELQEKQKVLSEARNRKARLQEIKDIWSTAEELKMELESPKKCTEKYIKRVGSDLQTQQKQLATLRSNLKRLEKKEILEKQLRKMEKIDLTFDDLNTELTEVKSRLSYLLNTEQVQAERRQEIVQEIRKLDIPEDMDLTTQQEELESLLTEKANLTAKISRLTSQLDKDVCPTCNRPFDISQEKIGELQSTLRKARSKLKKSSSQVHILTAATKTLQKYNELKSKLEEIPTKRKLKAIQVEIEKLYSEERDVATRIEYVQRRKSLVQQLEEMPAGSVVSTRRGIQKKKLKAERMSIKLDNAKAILRARTELKTFTKASVKEVSSKIKVLENRVSEYTDELTQAAQEVAEAKIQHNEILTTRKRYNKVQKALQKAQDILDHYECYKALKVAFGQKGLKHDRLHAILCDATERTVPIYTSLLWPNKNVTLELEPGDNSIRFQLLRQGSNVGTSSRAISGGESHKSGLAFLFGLRDLKEVYTQSSGNVLILDEPFSHLDPQGKEALIQVLKVLSQRFSSIFVVSHLPEVIEHEAWSQVWWAIREDNESKLYRKPPPARYIKYARRFAEITDH